MRRRLSDAKRELARIAARRRREQLRLGVVDEHDNWLVGSPARKLPDELSEESRAVLLPGAHVAVVTRDGEVWAGRVREWVGAVRLHPFGWATSLVFDLDDLIYAQPLLAHTWEQRSEVARRQAAGEPARRLPPKRGAA
ncbi:MAG: hypothetical protein R3B72_05885 [Polyangiaceae bacterium]